MSFSVAFPPPVTFTPRRNWLATNDRPAGRRTLNARSLCAPFEPDLRRNFTTGLPLPSPDTDPPDSVGGPGLTWVR